MKILLALILTVFATLGLLDVAFAQAASTSASAQPWVDFLEPYVTIIVKAAVTGLLGFAVLRFEKLTGIKINEADVARVRAAAATHAGIMVAGAADNLKDTTINVRSETVKSAADLIISVLPDVINRLGYSSENVKRIVVGEIGKLQASSPAITAPAVIQTGEQPLTVVEGKSSDVTADSVQRIGR